MVKYGVDKFVKGGIIKRGSDDVIEKEQEYGIPYGADALNADLEYINSDAFAQKFNMATDNAAVNKTLLECSRASIVHRNGTYYEDMYIIDGNSGIVLASQLNAAKPHGINHTEEMDNAICKAHDQNIPIIALHTHPEGFPPSVDDFNSAFKFKYKLAVVAGHNGQVYVYNNPRAIILSIDDVQSEIAFRYHAGVDTDRAYQEAYTMVGIGYRLL